MNNLTDEIKELRELGKLKDEDCGEHGHKNCRNSKGEMCWVRSGHAQLKLYEIIDAELPRLLGALEDAITMAKEFRKYDHAEDCYSSDDSDFENCTCSMKLARKFLEKHGITSKGGDDVK